MRLFRTVEPDSYITQGNTLLMFISRKQDDNYFDLLVELHNSVDPEAYTNFYIYLGYNKVQVYDKDLNLTQYILKDIGNL
jgi:hypothetical protein